MSYEKNDEDIISKILKTKFFEKLECNASENTTAILTKDIDVIKNNIYHQFYFLKIFLYTH
jgi:hypothetical protein